MSTRLLLMLALALLAALVVAGAFSQVVADVQQIETFLKEAL